MSFTMIRCRYTNTTHTRMLQPVRTDTLITVPINCADCFNSYYRLKLEVRKMHNL